MMKRGYSEDEKEISKAIIFFFNIFVNLLIDAFTVSKCFRSAEE